MKKLTVLSFLVIALLVLSSCGPRKEPELNIFLNPGIDTVEINSTFIDAGAKATVDNVQHNATVVSNNVDVTTLGEYTITYEFTHGEKTLNITRHVHVIDETPPVITLVAGIDTVFVGDDWIDAGANVTDNSLETLSYEAAGQVNTEVAGQYIITYTATDSSGNTESINRIVMVIERD